MMRTVLLALLAVTPCLAAQPAPYGVLLMAHGGDKKWDAEIMKVRNEVNAKIPTELALGMADPSTLQAGLDKLASRGVTRVVAVPLFVHSHSEVLDQTRYVLGLAEIPSEPLRLASERLAAASMPKGRSKDAMAGMSHPIFSLTHVKTSLAVAMTSALDDAPLVSQILLEHAQLLSREPKRETVVLVAHGPVDDAAVQFWNDTLARQAEFVRRGGGFLEVFAVVLRDDAEPDVRAAAVASLRARVARGSQDGHALVVPVLIARGGIEDKLPRDLEGLSYRWDGKTLMPHPGFGGWVLASASATAKQSGW